MLRTGRTFRYAHLRNSHLGHVDEGFHGMIDYDAGSVEMIARVFDGKMEGLTRDDVLDNITLYWLTNTAFSSAQL